MLIYLYNLCANIDVINQVQNHYMLSKCFNSQWTDDKDNHYLVFYPTFPSSSSLLQFHAVFKSWLSCNYSEFPIPKLMSLKSLSWIVVLFWLLCAMFEIGLLCVIQVTITICIIWCCALFSLCYAFNSNLHISNSLSFVSLSAWFLIIMNDMNSLKRTPHHHTKEMMFSWPFAWVEGAKNQLKEPSFFGFAWSISPPLV